jgi:membrane-associated phospholipid phosphatase
MKRRKSSEERTEMISIDTPAEVAGNVVLPSSADVSLRDPRTAALACLGVYLVASGFTMVISHPWLAAAHAAGVVVAVWALLDRRPVARTVGDFLPLFVAPMLYGEVPLLIGALGSSYHDVRVQSWELAIFGQHPSRVLATFMPNPAWSELLHMGYLAYYPAIFVPPLLLYVRGERRGYAQTVLALTVAYLACWVIFAVGPVEGPRYLWTPNAPDGPIRRLTLALLAAGSSRGAAFPSSHMAISVVQTVLAFRWQPKMGAILALVAVLVGLGAVYGGFHYGVDIIAGAVLGVVVGLAVVKAGPPVASQPSG